jgi:hypothetical protein
VGPRAILDVVMRKILSSRRESFPSTPGDYFNLKEREEIIRLGETA